MIDVQTQFQHYYQNLDFNQCRILLQEWNPKSQNEKFIRLRMQALIDFENLNFADAFIAYERLIELNPNHQYEVEYLLCLYHLGLHVELDRQLQVYLTENTKFNQLSPNKRFESYILLAKILEAKGYFDETEQVINLLDTMALDPYQRQALCLYQLRFKTEYGDSYEVHELLGHVRSGQYFNQDFIIEREHTLLLVDFRLQNFESAFIRYNELSNHIKNIADIYFLQSEMIEQIIIHGLCHRLSEIKLHQPTSKLKYELTQFELIHTSDNQALAFYTNIIRHEKSIDQLLYIRLIRQVNIWLQNTEISDELRIKYQSLIKYNIQEKYQKYFQLNIQSKNLLLLKINLQNKSVHFNNISIQLNSSLQMNLLFFLEKNNTADIESIIYHLYQQKLDFYNFEKIRSLVFRINQSFKIKYGIHSLIQITDSQIRLNPQVSLACVD